MCVQVQSLQSELQFKEAEINEIKTKLHSSDKNKMASPLPRNRSVIIIINRLDNQLNVLFYLIAN